MKVGGVSQHEPGQSHYKLYFSSTVYCIRIQHPFIVTMMPIKMSILKRESP